MLLCSASLHPCSPTSSRLSSISMTATDRRAVLLSSLALCGTVLPRAAHGEVESPTEQPAEAPLQRLTSAYDFDVPFRGEPVDIKPFLGKANIFVNVKFDDPETIATMPGLEDLVAKYAAEGLHVLAFPTDQGWFEADDSNTLRIKFKQVYNFGQYPSAVVFDKYDLLGSKALPLYSWLTKALPNQWGVNRIVFDYERFLVDEKGLPLRRYPRSRARFMSKYPVEMMEADVRAIIAGKPLPPPTLAFLQAWEDAKREATKSEYAFKPGLNYYTFGSPAS